MLKNLTKWQREILSRLLDKYEKSKTYTNENRVVQVFKIDPVAVFADYNNDYANVDHVTEFEKQVSELENNGLIDIKRKGGVVKRIIAKTDKLSEYYMLLEREEKKSVLQKYKDLYLAYIGTSAVLDGFCNSQLKRLEENKKPLHDLDTAKNILELILYIVNNKNDILERELSIAVLSDTKEWKKYRTRVCNIIFEYANVNWEFIEHLDDKHEREQRLLEYYSIYSNPSYVYVKGDGYIVFKDGYRIELTNNYPMAFSSESIKNIEQIHVATKTVMTIENLTSFNRMQSKDTMYIFLSGYHNSSKQAFLKCIYRDNHDKEYKHFGDIDPDGFYILENLCKGTGIDFMPAYMDKEMLEKYKKYTKPLEKNDLTKAKNLLRNPKYNDVITCILETKCKLEQEIVSWNETIFTNNM